ncbi:hypothetical protein I307_01188 [Cryptococcus deuterogattii 99/473]|uniref:Uncharacterized protein n=1 Tax=Cryptococcus deuterogattii Ram5 TaxID=1296110 RepID=A0A0D0V631_9TREE|nr:hypothetical protein I313_01041 [Cryptococcus deuterogattii Ram5]KIY59517.1 hypothetical protein I307_01188 [Cryptococcus deuterogattii 99/473]
MLRINGSDEYINQTQVDTMRPLLENFWTNSISWTTTLGSWTTIHFNVGSYTAQQASIDYHKLLYNATNLQDGYTHNLTFTNAGNQTFAFDYAIIEESIYDNIAVTASNSFASATTKANTEPALPFNDTTATAAQNSAARLSALSHQTYHVKWNGAMYFLVIFSSMMGAALVVWLSQLIVKRKLRKKERGSTGRLNDGIFLSPRHPEKGWSERCETEQRSDIIVFDESRFKRTTKLLEALRGKNISHPIESGEGRYDSSRE